MIRQMADTEAGEVTSTASVAFGTITAGVIQPGVLDGTVSNKPVVATTTATDATYTILG